MSSTKDAAYWRDYRARKAAERGAITRLIRKTDRRDAARFPGDHSGESGLPPSRGFGGEGPGARRYARAKSLEGPEPPSWSQLVARLNQTERDRILHAIARPAKPDRTP
jgi:hypothetical protein